MDWKTKYFYNHLGWISKYAAEVQDEICETYRLDFNKYKPKTDINCLKSVFSTIAANVGKQIKHTGLAVDFTPLIKSSRTCSWILA